MNFRLFFIICISFSISGQTLQDLSPRLAIIEPDKGKEQASKDNQILYYTLNLSDKDLTDITGIKELKVKMAGIPVPLKTIPNARVTIKLDHNKLTTLPDELKGMGVTHLDISNNSFTEFPTVIKNLENLVELDISYNKIKTVPPALSLLDKLMRLNVSHNEISQLPMVPWYPLHLTIFNISYNKLSAIPSSIGGNNLKEVDFSHNNIKAIAQELMDHTDLKTLDLANNELIQLPSMIGDLINLDHLYLDNNQLTSLPSSLAKLSHLKVLSYDNNPTLISPDYLVGLKKSDSTLYDFLEKLRADSKLTMRVPSPGRTPPSARSSRTGAGSGNSSRSSTPTSGRFSSKNSVAKNSAAAAAAAGDN